MPPVEEQLEDAYQEHPHAEEMLNAATHGVGLLLSVVGMAAIVAASDSVGVGLALACGLYAATLVVVYSMSTLSHAVQWPRAKHLLRVWDQGTIYLLIAGTYTPFMWFYLSSAVRWGVLAALWGAALWGFYSKVIVRHRVNRFSAQSYVLLGWLPALTLMSFASLGSLVWMALGGVSYTAGTWFLKRQQRFRYFHAVWHVLVIVGSLCHFYAIFTLLMLGGTA